MRKKSKQRKSQNKKKTKKRKEKRGPYHFQLRTRNSIRGFVRPSVGWSVRRSVTLELKSGKNLISAPAHPSATGGRVSSLVLFSLLFLRLSHFFLVVFLSIPFLLFFLFFPFLSFLSFLFPSNLPFISPQSSLSFYPCLCSSSSPSNLLFHFTLPSLLQFAPICSKPIPYFTRHFSTPFHP